MKNTLTASKQVRAPRWPVALASLTALLLLAGWTAHARAAFVFWVDNKGTWNNPQWAIMRANSDSAEIQTVIPDIGPWGGDYASLVVESGRIFWPYHSANLDGTGFQEIDNLPGNLDARVMGSAFDSAGNMYYPTKPADQILRAGPGGSEPIVTDMPYLFVKLAMDSVHSKLYWAASWDYTDSGLIQRSNLDGSSVETIVTSEKLKWTDEVHDLALDLDAGKMYWVNFGKIQRANLDGTGVEDFVTGIHPSAVAVLVPEPAVVGLTALVATLGVRPRRHEKRRKCT